MGCLGKFIFCIIAGCDRIAILVEEKVQERTEYLQTRQCSCSSGKSADFDKNNTCCPSVIPGNTQATQLSLWFLLAPQTPHPAHYRQHRRRRTTDPKTHPGTLAGRPGDIAAVGRRPGGTGGRRLVRRAAKAAPSPGGRHGVGDLRF